MGALDRSMQDKGCCCFFFAKKKWATTIIGRKKQSSPIRIDFGSIKRPHCGGHTGRSTCPQVAKWGTALFASFHGCRDAQNVFLTSSATLPTCGKGTHLKFNKWKKTFLVDSYWENGCWKINLKSRKIKMFHALHPDLSRNVNFWLRRFCFLQARIVPCMNST